MTSHEIINKNNQSIIVDNFISISNQSIISPEIVFISKPISVSSKKYYKLFVKLNYNPYIVDEKALFTETNFEKLQFNLFENETVKEIKPVVKIDNKLTINNMKPEKSNIIEFNIPIEIAKNDLIFLNFGVSYEKNLNTYIGKGLIKINIPNEFGIDFEQKIVSYFKNYDYEKKVISWESLDMLKANHQLIFEKLLTQKKFDSLLEIKTNFLEEIPNEILKNLKIYDFIKQVKNNEIFKHFQVLKADFENQEDFKKFYKGSLKLEFTDSKNNSFLLKAKNIFDLNENTKVLSIDESKDFSEIVFNPYSWNKNQNLIIIVSIMGKEAKIKLKLNTFSNYYVWNQEFKFNYNNNVVYKYKLNKDFWLILNTLNENDFEGELKKYEN